MNEEIKTFMTWGRTLEIIHVANTSGQMISDIWWFYKVDLPNIPKQVVRTNVVKHGLAKLVGD